MQDKRTSIIFKNTLASIALKSISFLISLLLVPISLNYLSRDGYGLWSALSSILAWFFIFDIGLGNGLRNKIIELKASNKFQEVKYYVSTAYFIFSVLVLLIIFVFLIVNMYVDWGSLLKASNEMKDELGTTAFVVFSSMCVLFVTKLINTVLIADLRTGVSDSLGVISHAFCLLGIILLGKISKSSLFYFAIIYTGSNLLVTIIATVILFNTLYKSISPSVKFIKIKLWHSLASIGIRFFAIQIFALILFQTTGLILSNLLGPGVVADYTITNRYYSAITFIFVVLTQSLWTGYGDAYYRNDYSWIRMTINRLKKLWSILSVILLIMLAVQKVIFQLWLGGKIQINYTISVLFVFYYILQMWASIYEPLINATSKLYIQLLLSSILIPLFIPLSVYLIKYLELGPAGILVATILINGIPMAFFSWFQSNKILNHTKGIWNK